MYRSSDLALVTALSMFLPIANINKEKGNNRCIFEFEDKKRAEEIADEYYRDSLKVSPKLFFNQMKMIKSRIYSL